MLGQGLLLLVVRLALACLGGLDLLRLRSC